MIDLTVLGCILFICGIIGFALIFVFMVDWDDSGKRNLFIGIILVILCCTYIILCFISIEETYTSKTIDLYAISSNAGAKGVFIWGTGTVESEIVYTYFTKYTDECGNEYYKNEMIYSPDKIILTDKITPRIEIQNKRSVLSINDFKLILWSLDWSQSSTIYIPEGSIRGTYNLN